jgi:hypothetical protein
MTFVAAALRISLLALLLSIITVPGAEAFQPITAPSDLVVQASQSINPCYKKCVMDRAWGNATRACQRFCRSIPSQQCESRCFRAFPNDPRNRKKCVSRC